MIFCLLLILLAAVPLYFGTFADTRAGWDYRVYMGAVQAVNHNQNPYNVDNVNRYTGDNLPFTYPPHTLLFFWLLQFIFIFQNIWVYYTCLIILMFIGAYLLLKLDNRPEYLLLATLIFTGFIGLFWNFITGNKDILFFFLFAVILFLIVRKKFWESSVITALTGSISLITIPFIALFFLVKRSFMERLKYILIAMGVLAAIFLASFCITPGLFMSYLDTIGGASSPLHDPSGYYSPTPFTMFGDILNRVGAGGLFPLVIVSLGYAGIVLYCAWYCIREHYGDDLTSCALGMMFIFMLLPRTKPYDYIVLAVPLYVVLKDHPYRWKVLALAGISLLPILVWYSPWYLPEGVLPFILDSYVQTVSLFFIAALIVIYHYISKNKVRG